MLFVPQISVDSVSHVELLQTISLPVLYGLSRRLPCAVVFHLYGQLYAEGVCRGVYRREQEYSDCHASACSHAGAGRIYRISDLVWDDLHDLCKNSGRY